MLEGLFWEDWQPDSQRIKIICQITVQGKRAFDEILLLHGKWRVFSKGFNYRKPDIFYLTVVKKFDRVDTVEFKEWIANFPGSLTMIKDYGEGNEVSIKKQVLEAKSKRSN